MTFFLKKILTLSLGLCFLPLLIYGQSFPLQYAYSGLNEKPNIVYSPKSSLDSNEKNGLKCFTQIDFSIMGIDTKISYFNVYGNLGLNFFLTKAFYLGPNFSYKLASTTDHQVIEVDKKQIDVNKFSEWGAGLTIGGALFRHSRIIFSPEIQIDYYNYILKDIKYNESNKLCINSSYIGWTPQIYFGAKISDLCSIGAKIGYRFPLYIKGSANDVYNPQSYIVGLFFRFALSK